MRMLASASVHVPFIDDSRNANYWRSWAFHTATKVK